ncbi:MAG: GGDEF domain-containing protein [Bacilli bacterium]
MKQRFSIKDRFHLLMSSSFECLSKKSAIKKYGLNDQDIVGIYHSMMLNTLLIEAILALFAFLAMVCYLFLGVFYFKTSFENYGFIPYMSAGSMILGSIILYAYLLFGDYQNNENEVLPRIISIIFQLLLLLGILMFFNYDAFQGRLIQGTSMSSSVIWIMALTICPMPYLLDCLVVLGIGSIGLSGEALYFLLTGYIKEFPQYIVIVIGWVIMSICVRAVSFSNKCYRFKEHEQNENLKRASIIDPLTDCHNRMGLTQYFDFNKLTWIKNHSTLSFLMIDIDNFKQINDSFSHLDGDQRLVEISNILRNSIFQYQVPVFRFGGDEFLIILSDITAEETINVAERLRKSVEESKIMAPEEIKFPYITCSIGIGRVQAKESLSLYREIDEADNQLYKAKKAGRNSVFYQGSKV